MKFLSRAWKGTRGSAL